MIPNRIYVVIIKDFKRNQISLMQKKGEKIIWSYPANLNVSEGAKFSEQIVNINERRLRYISSDIINEDRHKSNK